MSARHLYPRLNSTAAATGNTLMLAVDKAERLLERIEYAFQVRRERRELARLDERLLKDIGLGRGEAYLEASREFGDLPHNCR